MRLFANRKKHKITVNHPRSGAPCKISRHGVVRTVRNQPRTTREDLVNDFKAAGTIVTKKTIGNTTLWRTEILQRPQGPPAQERTRTGPSEVWKSSSLASTQLTVFGRGGMLPMTTRTPSPLSNMEVETLCFAGVFLLRGQDNYTPSKGQWTGPCTVRSRALKTVRALKMGRGWVFQHDNDPKHTEKTQTSDLCDYQQGFCHQVQSHILRRGQIFIWLIKIQINV